MHDDNIDETGRAIFKLIKPNIFVTLTLKQSIIGPLGQINLSDEEVVRSAAFFRDRTSRAIRHSYPNAAPAKFVAFYHGRTPGRRKHLHIGIELLPDVPIAEFREIVRSVTSRRDWIFEAGAKGRSIGKEVMAVSSYGEDQGLYTIFYGLKEGSDSYLPEASNL